MTQVTGIDHIYIPASNLGHSEIYYDITDEKSRLPSIDANMHLNI